MKRVNTDLLKWYPTKSSRSTPKYPENNVWIVKPARWNSTGGYTMHNVNNKCNIVCRSSSCDSDVIFWNLNLNLNLYSSILVNLRYFYPYYHYFTLSKQSYCACSLATKHIFHLKSEKKLINRCKIIDIYQNSVKISKDNANSLQKRWSWDWSFHATLTACIWW